MRKELFVTIEKTEKIIVNDKQIKSIVKDYIKEIFGLQKMRVLKIKNNKLFNTYEAYTSHSFDITDEIRDATDDDKLAIIILDRLGLNY